MNNLKAKLKKQGGFTLIEMLIVVAIIAILIAVSIPLIGNALEKARDATDQANERAAKAEAAIMYLGVGSSGIDFGTADDVTLWYDAANGKLLTQTEAAASTMTPYGQCTKTHTAPDYTGGPNTGKIIKVTVTKEDGTITVAWDTKPT